MHQAVEGMGASTKELFLEAVHTLLESYNAHKKQAGVTSSPRPNNDTSENIDLVLQGNKALREPAQDVRPFKKEGAHMTSFEDHSANFDYYLAEARARLCASD
jgi:hypothetical protein